jgi:hypothetical protein
MAKPCACGSSTHDPGQLQPVVTAIRLAKSDEQRVRPSQSCAYAACMHREGGASHGVSFQSQGGLFADEAIQLLQQFYVCGNPQGVWRWEFCLRRLLCRTIVPCWHRRVVRCIDS